MTMKSILTCLILFSVADVCLAQQDRSLDRELQEILEKYHRDYPKSVGIALHVEAPETGISWGGAAGYSDRETNAPLSPGQPGQIGSITKTFVACAILRLVETGQLELDQPISGLLHSRTLKAMVDNGYTPDSITVSLLLSHRSGLADIDTAKWNKMDLRYRWTRDEQIQDALAMQPRLPPGQKWIYSDVNYLLLTEIIEQVTGTSFYLAMRDLIGYEKLGLEHTWFYTLERDPDGIEKRVHQYKESRNWESTYDESPTWGLYGSAGIVSTAADLARFSQALFSGDVYSKPETLGLMHTEVPTSDGRKIVYVHQETMNFQYFLGLEHITTTGLEFTGHSGYWGTWMAWFPKYNASIGLFVLNADIMEQLDKNLMRDVLKVLDIAAGARAD